MGRACCNVFNRKLEHPTPKFCDWKLPTTNWIVLMAAKSTVLWSVKKITYANAFGRWNRVCVCVCVCMREREWERDGAEFYVIRHSFWSSVHHCRFRLPTPSKIAAISTLSRNEWNPPKKNATEIEIYKKKPSNQPRGTREIWIYWWIWWILLNSQA